MTNGSVTGKMRSLPQLAEALKNPESQAQIDQIAEEILYFTPKNPKQEKTQNRLLNRAVATIYAPPKEPIQKGFADLEGKLQVRCTKSTDVRQIKILSNALSAVNGLPLLRNDDIIRQYLSCGVMGDYERKKVAVMMYNPYELAEGEGMKIALFGLAKPDPELARVFLQKILEDSDYQEIILEQKKSYPKARQFAKEVGFVHDSESDDPDRYLFFE